MPTGKGAIALIAVTFAAWPAVAEAAPTVRMFSSIAGTEFRDVLGTYRYTARSAKPAHPYDLTVGLSATARVMDWLSVDVIAMTSTDDDRRDPWHERSIAAAFGAKSPSARDPAAHVTGRTRAMIATASLQRPLSETFGVYARLGAARSETHLFVTMPAGGDTLTFRDATIRPWGGVGARYDFRPSLSLTAEHGSANEGLRMSRFTVVWTF